MGALYAGAAYVGPGAMQSDAEKGEARSILIVDDERAVRDLFAAVLERAGHQVETATSGEEMLERLKSHDYDVIFLDVLLRGGMNGFDVFDELERRGTRSRVVFVTGRPCDERQMDYFHRADAFLTKPIKGLHQILEAAAGQACAAIDPS